MAKVTKLQLLLTAEFVAAAEPEESKLDSITGSAGDLQEDFNQKILDKFGPNGTDPQVGIKEVSIAITKFMVPPPS